MSDRVPRLRMFAGPNGSGKSTLKTILPSSLLGSYLNADDIERELRTSGFLDLAPYGTPLTALEAQAFFGASFFLKSAGFTDAANQVTVADGKLRFEGEVNSYVASVVTDLLRQGLLRERISFSLETVMSHPSKVFLLKQAQQLGFRTYLYFVATDDPEINIARVKTRVLRGGHGVPREKIEKRYQASLGLLEDGIRHTNRAYIFDNSGEGKEMTWLAEVTNGRDIEMKCGLMPKWFKSALVDKLAATGV